MQSVYDDRCDAGFGSLWIDPNMVWSRHSVFRTQCRKTEVFNMNNESMVICEGIEVPESALLVREHRNRYGSVPGLDDEELADPDELERQVMIEEFGPIWALPVQGSRCGIRPEIDEDGRVDWSAFGTIDFERYRGHFDKARYKAEKLRDELRDLVIRMATVKQRLPGKAKYMVLKYLRMGIIGLVHIVDADMVILARLYLRARKVRQEIWQLEEASEARMRGRLERFLVN